MAEELPAIYTVEGTAIDRRTRRGAAGLRVEAWDAAQTYLLGADETGSEGQFGFAIAPDAGGAPPQPRFRVYRDGQLLAQPSLPVVWSGAYAKVFLDIDVPTAPPKSYRVVGRLVDTTSRAGLPDLRVEAWDTAPGGAVGAATVSAGDGASTSRCRRVATRSRPCHRASTSACTSRTGWSRRRDPTSRGRSRASGRPSWRSSLRRRSRRRSGCTS